MKKIISKKDPRQSATYKLFNKVNRKILPHLIILVIVSSLSAYCSNEDQVPLPGGSNSNPTTWLIPTQSVVDGGPGKDGIPSIDQPQFSSASSIDFLQPSDLVLGINVNGDIRAYPHPILDWHEIVNDVVDNSFVAITYCPLTGTGIGWNRFFNGQETTFGVSGLLYNSNLIPYDRASDSNWSQMLLKSVNGDRSGTEIETIHLIETTWQTWQEMFPDSRVLNLNTGFQRSYGLYPYGTFRTNNDFLIFSVTPDDPRLPRKERGLGLIVGGSSRFYSIESFADTDLKVIEDIMERKELVVAGSKEKNFVVAYYRQLPDGTLLDFQVPIEPFQPAVMIDNEGNHWNLFGEAIDGPRLGQRLTPVNSFMGYWFAWGAFYPGIEIYE